VTVVEWESLRRHAERQGKSLSRYAGDVLCGREDALGEWMLRLELLFVELTAGVVDGKFRSGADVAACHKRVMGQVLARRRLTEQAVAPGLEGGDGE
jgi:hypothetical protein